MLPESSNTALKEWAVTIEALARGDQALLLRKGGIREEGKHFAVRQRGFFLYPSLFHQGADLLKSEARGRYSDALSVQEQPGVVTLPVYAEVTDVIEVTDERAVAALDPFHIWAPDYAQKRMNWKPRHPLHVMFLRCHRLQTVAMIEARPEYGGCRSWVTLERPQPLGDTVPCMEATHFGNYAAALKMALAQAALVQPAR